MTTVVYCEAGHRHALELIAKARTLSSEVIALCEDEAACGACLAAGADRAALLPLAPDDCAQGDAVSAALYRLAPDSVLFPATVRGRFLSGWAAARLQTGLTADCTALGVTPDGLLLQSRPAFGGNLTADILCCERRPQMASVRPGVFPMPETEGNVPAAPIEKLDVRPLRDYLTREGFTPAQNAVSLQDAQVIVAGGKGVGSRKGFDKLFRLAALLGGAVGATRSAVDAGYIGYAHQIGQTGVTVRPRLYIVFGASGAIQHTVGMSAAKTVIAVNRDRLAPIFRCADYGVAADWEETIDVMISELSEQA